MLDKTSYHPDRHNQIVSIKRSELLRHAEDSAGAELEGTPIHHAKNTGQTLIGRSGLFDLQWTELPIAFQNDVDLFSISVAVEVEIRFLSRILIAFHNFRHGEVFQQCATHGAAFGHLRRGPSGQITNQTGIIEIHFRRLDGTFEDVIGIGV